MNIGTVNQIIYHSTRDKNLKSGGAEAILQGIAGDGGLFVPSCFVNRSDLIGKSLPYHQLCKEILSTFFSELELGDAIEKAYRSFSVQSNAVINKVGDNFILELFHGPTCAFKDFALQVLPILIQKSKEKLGVCNKTLILTATSGDTGKAALEGFTDVKGIDIIVIYPMDGVSEMQKSQMLTHRGNNVLVLGIDGNFDDAQRAVKSAFLNRELKGKLSDSEVEFSSANSINIGRLIPQIAYYFFAYNELMRLREIEFGEKISFTVPTGNFGDILAGYYAKKMGLPIEQLVCASNENKVLKEFFETGIYDRRRALIKTDSPSMDIVISSNLERLLFHVLGDDSAVRFYMKSLDEQGYYELSEEHKKIFQSCGIIGGYCKRHQSHEQIKSVFEMQDYLMDTHTAVAWFVMQNFRGANKMVVLSTASPYKFSPSVCDALGIAYISEEDAMEKLHQKTGKEIPKPLSDVLGKDLIHRKEIHPNHLDCEIESFVKNKKFTIRVPATSANIGAGFDVIGAALNLYTKFEVSVFSLNKKNELDDIDLEIEGANEAWNNRNNLFYRAYEKTESIIQSGIIPKKMYIRIQSDIPMSRGLGSSSAFIVAGVMSAFELSGRNYSREDILQIATQIEGHPDNVAPAIYGGLRASMQKDEKAFSMPLSIHDDLSWIALVPKEQFSTQKAREVLPEKVSLQDAVFNISRTAMLIAAFQNRDYSMLKDVLDDRLHQNYRKDALAVISEIFERAKDLRGVYLSGAGSTVMILGEELEKIQSLFEDMDVKILDLKLDFVGAIVFSEKID